MPDTISIIQAPSRLGLSTDGVQYLGQQLLDLGLAQRLDAKLTYAVSAPTPSGERDSGTTILNAAQIAAYTPKLADALGKVLDAGEFPLVLGGDCTILLGPILALRQRGRYGLLFIDGHADFFQPEAEPNGEGASMDLAWITGYGPDLVTKFDGFHPLVRAEDVVVLGFRDHDDQAEAGSQPLPAEMMVYDLPSIRRLGIKTVIQQALARLVRDDLDGFFIHFDADVLEDAIMPAVDFRIKGGLTHIECMTALNLAFASGHATGLEVTIYNPTLDDDRRAGTLLVDILAEAFAGANQP